MAGEVMEVVRVVLGQDLEFDQAVHGGGPDGLPVVPDAGDLAIITKDRATVEGRAGAVLTFTIEVDGKRYRAQTVVTLRHLLTALAALRGRYSDEGVPRESLG